MLEKLRSERGESIGEALAAMLIVALAALMLAGMTTAATRIVEKSEKAYNVYLDQRNYLESGGSSSIPKMIRMERAVLRRRCRLKEPYI